MPSSLLARSLPLPHVSSQFFRYPQKGAARQKAKEFLEVTLASGWLPSKKLFETADRMGIKQKTLRRALKDMGCRKRKDGMEGGFSWALSDC